MYGDVWEADDVESEDRLVLSGAKPVRSFIDASFTGSLLTASVCTFAPYWLRKREIRSKIEEIFPEEARAIKA